METKPKKKDPSLKLDQDATKSGNTDPTSKNSLVEETQDISPIRVDNGLPKVYSVNKQKGKKKSPKASTTNVSETTATSESRADKIESSNVSTQIVTAATEEVLQGEVGGGWSTNEPIIVDAPSNFLS